ncbi:MAG: acyl carrier protein [Proteobacteria bacterium]|nr:acyl carrier protein [Pseudomonadota bacterium]
MTDSNYDEIMQLLCDRLSSLTNSNAQISPETNLISQLSIDSIKLLNLIMEVEDAFDISIPINALADVQTVRELVDLVHKIKSVSQ